MGWQTFPPGRGGTPGLKAVLKYILSSVGEGLDPYLRAFFAKIYLRNHLMFSQ